MKLNPFTSLLLSILFNNEQEYFQYIPAISVAVVSELDRSLCKAVLTKMRSLCHSCSWCYCITSKALFNAYYWLNSCGKYIGKILSHEFILMQIFSFFCRMISLQFQEFLRSTLKLERFSLKFQRKTPCSQVQIIFIGKISFCFTFKFIPEDILKS